MLWQEILHFQIVKKTNIYIYMYICVYIYIAFNLDGKFSKMFLSVKLIHSFREKISMHFILSVKEK